MNQTCWQQRGCDEEMWSRCPHATSSTDGLCPIHCNFTYCTRPQHAQAHGLDLLDPDVDRSVAVKEACFTCLFFIQNAPRIVTTKN